MFVRFREWIRQVMGKMFPKKSVQQAIKVDVAVSDTMVNAIELWAKLYADQPPWISNTVQTLNLPSTIASELARLTTIELETMVTGSVRADYLNEQYQVVVDDLRRYTEYACAKGGVIFKPYIDGDKIAIDYVQADQFYPTAFNSQGEVTGAVFVEQKKIGQKYYTRLEYHSLIDGGYYVSNTAYVSHTGNDLGTQTTLGSVEEWAELQPEATINNIDKPLFAYFKIPQANNIDTTSPLGVSVYARAVDLIKEADKQYSRMLWEFEGGELAINADMDLFKNSEHTGEKVLPAGKERLYRAFDAYGDGSKPFFEVFSPMLREQSLINGLNKILQRIEFNCGLAYGTISDPQVEAKTATEIKSSNQRMYSTVSDIQKSLQVALEQLLYAMDVWVTLGNLAPAGTYEVTFNFDDSIINDAEVQRLQDKEDVRDGIMQKYEFRMKWYGEDEETAKKMVAQDTKPLLFEE